MRAEVTKVLGESCVCTQRRGEQRGEGASEEVSPSPPPTDGAPPQGKCSATSCWVFQVLGEHF